VQKTVQLRNIAFNNENSFTLIAGPCAIESRDHALYMAENLTNITGKYNIPFVFKSSYDKANRSSIYSARGVGLQEGLSILEEVSQQFDVPVLTDVHTEEQAKSAGEVVDIVQIPAFLCRQTDLLVTAAETGKIVNVKKGQFLAPWDMTHVVKKLEESGTEKILLTERGTSFGYNTLVSDMRGLVYMRDNLGYPVIFDATHSVQQPGGAGQVSGGQREYVEPLAQAATAIGISGVFVETHNDPDNAFSDGPNQLPLSRLPSFLNKLQKIDKLQKNQTL
jgi:2-dehydro-3-deoxyphosphooctonate aldolase (KDO 8-P synthase)